MGMKLVLADVQADSLAAITAELKAQSAAVIGELVNVADASQITRLADRSYAEFGHVHLLMNNAGVGGGGYLWEATEQDWQWTLGVNLLGIAHAVRAFVPRMLESERKGEPGYVVNTASMAGWLCPPLMGVYNASKHAAVALSETLYHDLRHAGSAIGVTVLCPAFVATGIHESHRNRPQALSNAPGETASQKAAQTMVTAAVTAGKLSATDVASITFDAVRANRFYAFTHRKIMPGVAARFAAVMANEPPADPYASRPDVRPAPVQ
jgi:NAD(P)-dependent dehydrogenase (short-subunit alcohol dehydrogenase family)